MKLSSSITVQASPAKCHFGSGNPDHSTVATLPHHPNNTTRLARQSNTPAWHTHTQHTHHAFTSCSTIFCHSAGVKFVKFVQCHCMHGILWVELLNTNHDDFALQAHQLAIPLTSSRQQAQIPSKLQPSLSQVGPGPVTVVQTVHNYVHGEGRPRDELIDLIKSFG